MESPRVGTTLAACLLIAAAACGKEVENNAQPKPGVGAKVDRALERTGEKLAKAGERAKEEVAEAAEKTQETLARAKDSVQGRDSVSSSPPYSPRQPVSPSGASAPGASPGSPQAVQDSSAIDATTTTTTLSSGPTTSVKVTGISADTRAAINDAAITASIKADLLRDPDLSVLKIDVDTRDGVVTLNGLAGNQAARTRAERMAQSVKGVREVRNHLTVKQA
jgi:osmotically-inducible protein OsmY